MHEPDSGPSSDGPWSVPRDRIRLLRRWAIFPIVVVAVFAALVIADLSGSSIAAFSDQPHEAGLIAGSPLGVRSDEYLLETPNAISSALQGNPAELWLGLSEVDQSVAAGGGATVEWSSLFKPQDWGYLLLDPGRGVAWSWWWPFVVCLVGTYALFGLVTRRPGLAGALAIAATFTPYSAWWSPAMFLGYGAAGGAAMLGAWTVRRPAVAVPLSLLAAWLIGAQTLALYPAWQFSVLLVVGALCLGLAIDRRLSWRRIGWTSAIAVVGAGSVVLAWYRTHAEAIAALAGTIYPGQRTVESGTGSLAVLLGAPLNFWMTGSAGESLGIAVTGSPFGNLSEASASWLPLPLVLLIAIGTAELIVRRRRSASPGPAAVVFMPGRSGRPPIWTLSLVGSALALLLVWTLVELPNWFGAITQLERIQPSRTSLAMGFAAILLVAIASTVEVQPTSWRRPFLLGAAILTAGATVWTAERLPWDASLVSTWLAALSGFAVAALLGAVIDRRLSLIGAIGFAAYAFASWVLVNPLQQGIAPLIDDPLAARLRVEADGAANPRTIVYGDLATVARVRAAGMQSLSGTTPYPDRELMSRLAPDDEALWNNYAQYEWAPLPEGGAVEIERTGGSMMRLGIDPCDPILLAETDPGWAVSEGDLGERTCLVPVAVVDGAAGRVFRIYRFE